MPQSSLSQPLSHRMGTVRGLFAAFFLFLLLGVCVSAAVAATDADGEDDDVPGNTTAIPETRWSLHADSVSADNMAQIIEATGNVTLRSDIAYLKADYIRYYASTKWVYLRGNIETKWDDYVLNAEEAEFNLDSRTGWLTNGTIFVAKQNLHINGQTIRRLSGDTYSFENAKVTACDGDTPAWSIYVPEGDVTIGGYADLYNPRFQVLDQTVLWSPYASAPIKVERQSGFLFPEFGTGSRLGTYWLQPYYWAIDEENDLTLYSDAFSRRGEMLGLEYRTTPDVDSKGVFGVEWLNDRVVAATPEDEDDQFRDDGLLRPNRNRYWLRGKYDGWVPDSDLSLKFDLDYVSDQNYLREFDVGYMDYNRNRDMYLDEFGRGLDVVDSLTRTSTALVSRSWSEYAVNAKLEYTENLSYRNGNNPGDMDPTVQRFPELSAYAYKQWLLDSPLEYFADSSLGYYSREFGTTGTRMDLAPGLSLPLPTDYITVIPTLGWQETLYGVNHFENVPDGGSEDSFQRRGLPFAGVTAFSEGFRVYDLDDGVVPTADDLSAGNNTWVAMKHTIQPRVAYSWIPSEDQDELPEFDDLDRIEPRNDVRYSLINFFDRKRRTNSLRLTADNATEAYYSYDYLEFLRLRLEQGYDLREASRDSDLEAYPRRPFSDILGEIILQPLQYAWLTSKTFYSPYENKLVEHEHYLTLSHDDYGRISFGLDFLRQIDEYSRQNQEKINMLRLSGEIFLPAAWSLLFNYQRDYEEDENVETGLGFKYRHQCFDFTVYYTRTPFDERVALWFSFLGFSSPSLKF